MQMVKWWKMMFYLYMDLYLRRLSGRKQFSRISAQMRNHGIGCLPSTYWVLGAARNLPIRFILYESIWKWSNGRFSSHTKSNLSTSWHTLSVLWSHSLWQLNILVQLNLSRSLHRYVNLQISIDSILSIKQVFIHVNFEFSFVICMVKPFYPVPKGEQQATQYVLRKVAPRRIWPLIGFGASMICWYEHLSRSVCILLCKNHRFWEIAFRLVTFNRFATLTSEFLIFFLLVARIQLTKVKY